MNIRSLRIFVYVMEEGTLARAADRMHLSQSAASRQLAMLEQEFDVTLFSRDQKRLIPTPQAEGFYPEALNLLAQIDEIPEIFRRMRKDVRAPLRIVSQTRLANGLVLPAICAFARDHPDQTVNLEIMLRRDLGRRIMHRKFDICVSALPLPVEKFEPTRLGATSLCIALPRAHPLATRSVIGPKDLRGVPYIALDESTVLRRLIDRHVTDLERPTYEVSVGTAAYRLVYRGLGFAFADAVSLDPELTDGIALVPWEQDLSIEYGYFTAERGDTNQSAHAFGQILQQQFQMKSHQAV
ncbi:LysR family transcriptional regulator [Jannaschia sp. CCS1]|uniref:LysR family transcriptional regulator n=1 Tax=Jannaschia sp. (strain CCS1) TaxID=290400 RepID=UPI000053A822|nr:LysR family transcriptional regulator [Jannaschia sp. CCS1]ABD53646.1 transcriptional regulator, LysR family [Jannaschia sp. CCS1]